MKFAILAGLLMTSFAAQAKTANGVLSCMFKDGYAVEGAILDNGQLRVDSYVGYDGENRDLTDSNSGQSLNENPVKAYAARDGRTKFILDNLSGDNDYGDACDLYLPSTLKTGAMKASYSCERYSRGPAGDFTVQGSCTLH